MNGTVKVNAKDFGVEEKDAKQLTTGLNVALAEREPLIKSYKSVIDMEITQENLPTFKELRLKIVKNRTQGIVKWHTTSKAFFLAGGRFCDALKNKEIAVNEGMEEKLMDAERYFENLEKERITKLDEDRRLQCVDFVQDEETILPNLGSLHDSIWDNYIIGLKASHTARIEADEKAETKRVEAERIEKLKIARENELKGLWHLVPETHPAFETLSNDEWTDFVIEMNRAKEAEIAEKKRIQAENQKLKEQAEAKSKQDEADRIERERLAEIEADKQAKIKAKNDRLNNAAKARQELLFEIGVKLSFEDCKGMPEDTWKEFYEEKNKTYQAEQNRLTLEKMQANKLAAKLKSKQEAEAAEELRLAQIDTDNIEAAKKAALAPEKDKIHNWIDSFNLNDIDSKEFSMNGQAAVNTIKQKFEAFKKWAIEQKETIK